MATIQTMVDEIINAPKKMQAQIANEKIRECLNNAKRLALANAKNFDSLDECLRDATIQFSVLQDVINESEKLMFELQIEPVDAFKKFHAAMISELELALKK